jgi:hypothetical protein
MKASHLTGVLHGKANAKVHYLNFYYKLVVVMIAITIEALF